jgi:glutamine synthetase
MPRKKPVIGPAPEGDEDAIKTIADARKWTQARRITEIECVIPDQAGVARGKIMPASKFFADPTMALPSSIFTQTITGEYPEDEEAFSHDPNDGDVEMVPDLDTLTVVPWARDPTAQIIHDAFYRDGRPLELAPRQVLRRVVELFTKDGLRPVVAPEIEFYLVKKNHDADYPLEPPVGRSGRSEAGRRSYSIAAVNEFEDLFEKLYDYAEAQELEVDTLIHEEGAAQMEINLRHGDPIWLADQVFFLKRTIREAALEHDVYATFMAKPMSNEPGSAMHIHTSLVDADGRNIFSDANGRQTPEFFHFIGGLQRYLPAVTVLIAPYVNSYRRLSRRQTAPTNTQWGYDNRTTGLRVPPSGPEARRVENRVPSSDANPYLAIAATLACGWLGMRDAIQPTQPTSGAASLTEIDLPRGLLEGVQALEDADELHDVFGKGFVQTYCAIKRTEFETFMQVISPWEREFLLLNV